MPSQAAGSGSNTPQPKSSNECCTILVMIHHLKFMNKKATKYALLVSSSLELRKSCFVSPRLNFQRKNGRGLIAMWVWSEFFCTLRVVMSYTPTTLKSTPMLQ